MKIDYDIITKIMIIILGAIFICEGFDLVFDFGFNHHLFHIFWLVVSFCIGVFVSKHWIE